MEPTEQQRLILNYNGCAVVIAAPGSGKTFVISQKIKQNLKNLLDHQGVIAISYTNKASAELKKRSLSNGEMPKSSFFGTIDKFNLSEIIIPFAKHLFEFSNVKIRILEIASLPDDELHDFNWVNRNLTFDRITDDQIEILKSYFKKGIILIETIGVLANYVFSKSLACQNYIKARYKYIYIDEYQDSGFEQHQIFLKIQYLNITAVAVGDLNQSIYAFSGKDAKYLEDLTQRDAFKYFKLDKNHRCHSSIINYSNYLLNPKTELISTDHNWIFFKRIDGNENNIALWIDQEIEKLKTFFNIEKCSQIAVLTRTTRTGEILNKKLKTPHKLAINNDLDIDLNVWSAIFSNLLYFLFDKNFKFIDVIEVFTVFEKFTSPEIKVLFASKTIIEELISYEKLDIEKLIKEFVTIACIIAPNSESNYSIDLLKEVLLYPLQLKSYIPAGDNEVNIMTLHKSKGLEFDLVFHLDLYEWVFPSKSPGANNDFKNPVFGDWQQDLNLHYVGITRARKACFLISSSKRTSRDGTIKNGSDSEFIWYNKIESLRYRHNKK